MSQGKEQRVIKAYPVLTLSVEGFGELFCPECGNNRWGNITVHKK